MEGAYQKEKGEWPSLRNLHEAVFPEAARKMCRVKDWTYKSLYIHVIEHAANQFKIPEFSIYTGEQIEALIKKTPGGFTGKGGSPWKNTWLCLTVRRNHSQMNRGAAGTSVQMQSVYSGLKGMCRMKVL